MEQVDYTEILLTISEQLNTLTTICTGIRDDLVWIYAVLWVVVGCIIGAVLTIGFLALLRQS